MAQNGSTTNFGAAVYCGEIIADFLLLAGDFYYDYVISVSCQLSTNDAA